MNDDLADLIQRHKAIMAASAYHTSLKQGFNLYKKFPADEAVGLVAQTLDYITTYLRTGEIDGWRNYVTEVAQQLLADGFTVEQINSTGAIIVDTVSHTIEHELDGPANEKMRVRYLRRLDGLKTLAVVSTVGAKYKPPINTDQGQA